MLGFGALISPVTNAVCIAVFLAITNSESQAVDVFGKKRNGIVSSNPTSIPIAFVIQQLKMLRDHPRIDEAAEISGRIPQAKQSIFTLFSIPAVKRVNTLVIHYHFRLEFTGIHDHKTALIKFQDIGFFFCLTIPFRFIGVDVIEIIKSQVFRNMEVIGIPLRAHGSVQQVGFSIFL